MDVRLVWTFEKWIQNMMRLKSLQTGLYSQMPSCAWKAEEMTRKFVIHCKEEIKAMGTIFWI